MRPPPRHDSESTRRLLRELELEVAKRLAGMVHGDYRGLFPGPGTEPGEGRPYVVGDDVRLIDWNLTARTGEPHVRDPIWDHELDLWILADLSPSMRFGTTQGEKRELALLAAAAFGFPARRLANRIGAVIVEGDRSTTIPLGTTSDHLLAVLFSMAQALPAEQSGRTDLSPALQRLERMAHRRSLLAVISDFLLAQGWQAALGRLAGRHSVVAVQIVDPRELHLPDVGDLRIQDVETGATRRVSTSDPRLRVRYARAAQQQQRAIAAAIVKSGADHVVLRTEEDWVGQIVQYFGLRRKRQQYYRPRWQG